MNFGNIELGMQCEKAVQLLCASMPVGEERKKPLLMHSLRVGMFLYEKNYSRDIVLGGLLHDVLEWTESSETVVRDTFGDAILAIVKANTKNREITDPAERRREYINRCIETGEDALIVKAADVLDSFRFYTATGNAEEIRRCKDMVKAIFEKLPETFRDPIFGLLRDVEMK